MRIVKGGARGENPMPLHLNPKIRYVTPVTAPFAETCCMEYARMFTTPTLQRDDAARVAALQKYAILDTEPEQAFEDLVLLAAYICGTPMAMISLVDENRQWFKSKIGLPVSETPRDVAFCNLAIQQSNLFVVEDARADARFRDNPLVRDDPGIRFYAGAPLINSDGYALGTLCVIDNQPRVLDGEQESALKALSRMVLRQMEFRYNLILLKQALNDRTKLEHEREREIRKLQETLLRTMGLRA